MKKLHKLITITGSSGTGKTTIAREIATKENTIVSFTSRKKRAGEVEGLDYYYRTKEEMFKMKENGEFIEFIEFNGNCYGYTYNELFDKLSKHDCVCVITYDGLEALYTVPELKDVIEPYFLFASKEKIENNLLNRGGIEEVNNRIKLYEMETINNFFFCLNLEQAKIINTTFLNKEGLIQKIKDYTGLEKQEG